jgi:hypothetical protein
MNHEQRIDTMKKIQIGLLAVVMLAGTSSCEEKFFDSARQQTNLATDQWGSTLDLERLVAGAYYAISSYAGFGGCMVCSSHTKR